MTSSERHRGEATTPEGWDDRELPVPHVRVAFAAIENGERFGSPWGQWVQRLGIRKTAEITTLAEGAGWIWQQAAMHFPQARGMLDIYHALEHVAETAKKIYGETTVRSRRWIDSIRTALLSGEPRSDRIARHCSPWPATWANTAGISMMHGDWPCQPNGKPLLPRLQQPLGPLLGESLIQPPKSVTAPTN
jgi:hypothetical protein